MTKKTYIKPRVIVFAAECTNIMAGSPLKTTTEDVLTNVTMEDGPTIGDKTEEQPFGAKKHNSWSAWDAWD